MSELSVDSNNVLKSNQFPWRKAILCALLVAGVVSLYNLIGWGRALRAGVEYDPIRVGVGWVGEDRLYAPIIRNFSERRFLSNEIYFRSEKMQPVQIPWLPAIIPGIITWLTGSIPFAFVLSRILGCAATALVAFALGWYISRVTTIAFLAAVVLSLRPFWHVYHLSSPVEVLSATYHGGVLAGIKQLVFPVIGLFTVPSVGTRLISPCLTTPWIIVSLLLVIHCIKNPTPRWAALTGLSIGILVYINPYGAAYIGFGGTLAVLTGSVLQKKYTVEPLSFFAGLGVGIPFVINLSILRKQPWFSDWNERIGYESGIGFRWYLWESYLFWIILFLLIVLAYRAVIAEDKPRFKALLVASGSILFAGFLVYHINLLTGKWTHPNHWNRYAISYGVNLASLVILSGCLKWLDLRFQKSHWKNPGTLFRNTLKIVTILIVIGTATSFARRPFKNPLVTKAEIQAWKALRSEVDKDATVLAFEPKIIYTSVYRYRYNSAFPYAMGTTMTNHEIEDRLLWAVGVVGGNPRLLDIYYTVPRFRIHAWGNRFSSHQFGLGLGVTLIPDKEGRINYVLPPPSIRRIAHERLRTSSPKEDVVPIEIDAVVVSPRVYHLVDANHLQQSGFRCVFDENLWSVYVKSHKAGH